MTSAAQCVGLMRGCRHGIAGKAAHPHLRRIDDTVGSRDFAFKIARDAAARCPIMLRRDLPQSALRARAVAIMHDKEPDTEIHQGECDGVPGASGADQHDRCTSRAVGVRSVSSKL